MAQSSELKGKWALVTGASAGIGSAIARDLAQRGANLILTSRRRERLETLAAELVQKGVDVRVVTADLNDPSAAQAIFDAVKAQGIDIEILINNAGLGNYGAFHTNEVEQELSQIRVNCDAVVAIARLFLPAMVERRRGWVMVVASTASFQPVPYISTYAATKAFDRMFALGIAAEVERFGVKVSALCPGPTESEFHEVAHAQSFVWKNLQSAEEVARIGVDGMLQGKRTVVPYAQGRFNTLLVRLLPVGLITRYVEKAARPKEKR
ncbi:MAG: SDR family oxidoreductase [Acidobacteriota bacterium]|nr:SDR family oxidoreductase [Acidobacteriota bacterium]